MFDEKLPKLKAEVKLMVYEGDIEYDGKGNIKNKLKEVKTYIDLPVEQVEVKSDDSDKRQDAAA